MIRRIQALHYRSLRHVDVSLDSFHVLVGPNASGKSTLLDVAGFLRDMVSGGLENAVFNRTRNFQDLVWDRPGASPGFELAVEFDIPEDAREQLPREKQFSFFRYETAIKGQESGEFRIESERGLLISRRSDPEPVQLELPFFPYLGTVPDTILHGGGRQGSRTILSKSPRGTDNYNIEVSERSGKGWAISISLGPGRSTLGNLPGIPDNVSGRHTCKATAGNGHADVVPGQHEDAPGKSARVAPGHLCAGRLQSSPGYQETEGKQHGGICELVETCSFGPARNRGHSRRGPRR